MPLYLDIHRKIEGLTKEALEEAHQKELAIQANYGVKFLRYWYDTASGRVYCLVDAPSKEAFEALHRNGNAMMADEITEVTEGL